jgi:adenylate kinase
MQCLGIPQISTGDMLREHIQKGDSLGREISDLMHPERWWPTRRSTRWWRSGWRGRLCAGFILDGYPRTRQQAEKLCRWLMRRGSDELVIHLQVDYNSLITRLPEGGSVLLWNPV